MTQTATQQLLIEARRITKAAGCFVSEKDGAWRVFRKTALRPVLLGFRSTPAALRDFVRRIAITH